MNNLLIKPHLIEIFKQTGLEEGQEPTFMYALRDKATKRLIEVAYSEEGLQWATMSRKVKNMIVHDYVFYKNAKPELVIDKVNTHIVEGIKVVTTDKRLVMKGDLSRNPRCYIEYPFVPRNHMAANGDINRNSQLREIMYSRKALKMLIDQQPYLRALQYREAKLEEELNSGVESLEGSLSTM